MTRHFCAVRSGDRARRQISRDVQHDAARLIERYQEMQATFTDRVIPGPESNPEQPPAELYARERRLASVAERHCPGLGGDALGRSLGGAERSPAPTE